MGNSFLKTASGIFIISFLASFSSYSADFKFIGGDNPPFYFSYDGKITGYLKAVIEAGCKKSQINCTFEIEPVFGKVMEKFKSGSVTGAILLLTEAGDKKKNLSQQVDLLRSPFIVVSTKNKTQNGILSDLTSYTFVIEEQVSFSLAACLKLHNKSLTDLKILYENDPVAILKKLNNREYGENAATFMNRGRLDFLSKLHKLQLNNLAEILSTPGTMGIKFSPVANQSLIKKFTNNISLIKSSGELIKIFKNFNQKLTKEIYKQ